MFEIIIGSTIRHFHEGLMASLNFCLGLLILTHHRVLQTGGFMGLDRFAGKSFVIIGGVILALGILRIIALMFAGSVVSARIRLIISVASTLICCQLALGFFAAGLTPSMGNAGTGFIAWGHYTALEIFTAFIAAREAKPKGDVSCLKQPGETL